MRKFGLFISGFLISLQGMAQTERPITTGVPFLLIASDARSAAMGDIGVCTSTDAFSQQHNPAKYAFTEKKQGFSVSYTPYLTQLVNDISLSQLTYYNKINERSAIGASLRYFSLGEIQLTDYIGNDNGIVKPNELALDLSYSLKLSENFSMAVGGRYIRSNLRVATGTQDATSANSFAVDVAGYLQSDEIAYKSFNGRWRGGFNFQNLGPKISYNGGVSETSSNFLPANMKLGGGFDFIFDDYNKLGLNLEINKLLVPTPKEPSPAVDSNGDGDYNDPGDISPAQQSQIAANEYNSVGWASGVFKSFGDAPGGFSEELREVTYGFGAEYWYQDAFALRAGYFNESQTKGARKYATIGAGFRYNVVTLDVSYLFSTSKVKNPLENTLRFSLTFNFGDSK